MISLLNKKSWIQNEIIESRMLFKYIIIVNKEQYDTQY